MSTHRRPVAASDPLHASVSGTTVTNNNSTSKGFDHRLGGSDSNLNTSASGFDYRDANNLGSNNMNDNNNIDAVGGEGIELGYLPPEQRHSMPHETLISQLVDPEIDEDTEAAEALRANANVKVGKVSKVARSINAQSVRKVAKVLTLRSQSGNRRGKPPRIPPGLTASSTNVMMADAAANMIYALNEEQSGDFRDDSDSQGSYGSKDDGVAGGPQHHHNHKFNASAPAGTLQAVGSDEMKTSDVMAMSLKEDHTYKGKVEESKATGSSDEQDVLAGARHSGATPEGHHQQQEGHDQHRHSQNQGDDKDLPVEVVAGTMATGRKLMGALDPHNMLQIQRWRRKKKGGKKKRKSYVKGKVIDGRHELYTLSIAVMLGVRTSIARTNTIIASTDRKKLLTAQDFMAEEKYEFAPKGSATTPPHKLSHTFKFKDYAPLAFAYLRRMFGINEFDFLLSVCGNANFIEFISNAKSGQFFFYSSDGKYMIKTMTNAESKFLRRILPHYFRHCTQNPNTLITKYMGMYRVKLYHLRRNVKFVIMNSVYYTDKSLQLFYDLKGSELGREAKPGEDCLKDNDLRRRLPEEAFNFKPDVQQRVRDQIVSDTHFLRRMQIMDYSMLIGVHHIPPKSSDVKKGIPAADTGLRIKERQTSLRQRKGSDSSNPMVAAASHVRDMHDGGSHTDGESVNTDDVSRGKMEGKLASSKADSSRKLIKDIRESTYNATNLDFAGLLEEEDDCSYLEFSEPYKAHMKAAGTPHFQRGMYDDVEIKKEQTVEQIYWPFHRFFDIDGYRRMKPKSCFQCNSTPCICDHKDQLLRSWKIPDFTPPLSDRKDGGLMMNTEGMTLPLTWHGPQGDRLHDGKIYYMGIIDILQQYNARKRIENRYRKMETRGSVEVSCVSPREYAERFVMFFDEYSTGAKPIPASHEEEKTQVEVSLSGRKNPNNPNSSTNDVDISVTGGDDDQANNQSEYTRAPVVEMGPDGKPLPPKKRVIVS